MQPFFIGLDIGTSNVKAVAFDLQGRFLNKKTAACRTLSPKPGWSEQLPEEIFKSAIRVLRQLVAEQGVPLGIAFSSAMHSLIAVDGAGLPLTNCLLWSDARSAGIAQALKGSALGKQIYEATGTPVHAMSPLPKITWLRENEPAIFKKTHQFLGIKEYVVFRMTGEYLTDCSVASATGLFDSKKLEWSAPALAFAGVGPEQLPQPVSPFFIFKNLKKEWRQKIVLPEGTPFVIGASDGCLANLGLGATAEGEAVLSIGTSGALRMTASSPRQDPQERIFNYLLTENQYVTGGASNNGAVVYEWFATQFFGMKPASKRMARHVEAAIRTKAGADGLLFLPYLLGERAPIWDASATAAFHGVTAAHTLAHFHRAVLEGILLNLRLVGQVLEETVAPIRCVLADGGFTKMDAWVQMVADVFGVETRTFESEDGPAFGAVLLAMKALGYLGGFDEIKSMLQPKKTFRPGGENHRVYRESLQRFKEMAEVRR